MTKVETSAPRAPHAIRDLTLYVLKLGTLGFGGLVALVGQMERDVPWRSQAATALPCRGQTRSA